MYTISTVLEKASQAFIHSDTPQLDAELLLAHVLNSSRTSLHTWPNREISEEYYQQFKQLCEQRQKGKPIAYLVGTQSFWKFDLQVTPDVLIPRPDTEIIVETILALFRSEPLKVLELGTGSGAIAIALADERPQWEIIATDKSLAALKVAKKNAAMFGVKNIEWYESDWFSALEARKFNLIVSNPPYIAANDPHLNALQYEPSMALVAEKNGLQDLECIIRNAQNYLLPNGYLIVEHGFQQALAVRELMQHAGFTGVESCKDLGGNDRITKGFGKVI